MENLSRLLKGLKDDSQFRFHPKCGLLGIMHLVFADDLLFFCKGDLKSVKSLLLKFEQFSSTSGLIANRRKCEVYFGGVRQEIKDSILDLSQLQED
ncbi:hypothetical protein OROMI_015946 [Orobanche minor]